MASLALNNSSLVEGDSEDEFDWEEVQVLEQRHLEITLQTRPKSDAVTKSVEHPWYDKVPDLRPIITQKAWCKPGADVTNLL